MKRLCVVTLPICAPFSRWILLILITEKRRMHWVLSYIFSKTELSFHEEACQATMKRKKLESVKRNRRRRKSQRKWDGNKLKIQNHQYLNQVVITVKVNLKGLNMLQRMKQPKKLEKNQRLQKKRRKFGQWISFAEKTLEEELDKFLNGVCVVLISLVCGITTTIFILLLFS